MAWTDPRTWTTGEIVTAAMMNNDIRDNMKFLFQNIGFSDEKDLSDVTVHSIATGVDNSTEEVFNISGEGVVVGGTVGGYNIFNTILTVDGVDNTLRTEELNDAAGNTQQFVIIPSVRFTGSAKLTFTTGGSTTRVAAITWTKLIG